MGMVWTWLAAASAWVLTLSSQVSAQNTTFEWPRASAAEMRIDPPCQRR